LQGLALEIEERIVSRLAAIVVSAAPHRAQVPFRDRASQVPHSRPSCLSWRSVRGSCRSSSTR